MQFLSATWRNLILCNYEVDAEILQKYAPRLTSIDSYEGKTFVSLVAFLFDNTRVMGIPVPFHRRFEEINLRFYVKPDKDHEIRAVTFVKEIVPKRIICWIANSFFQENYVTLPTSHDFSKNNVTYRWGRNLTNQVAAVVESNAAIPEPGSHEEFITEHYWGYAGRRERTREYRVAHPQWACCQVSDYAISVDFGQLYGEDFAFLSDLQPASVLFTRGSEITVSFPGWI